MLCEYIGAIVWYMIKIQFIYHQFEICINDLIVHRVQKGSNFKHILQLMCLADLEFDYINPYDSASRINFVINLLRMAFYA